MGRRKKHRKKRKAKWSQGIDRIAANTVVGAGAFSCLAAIPFVFHDSFSSLPLAFVAVPIGFGIALMAVGYRAGQSKEEREHSVEGLPKPDLEKIERGSSRSDHDRSSRDEYDISRRRDDDDDDDDDDDWDEREYERSRHRDWDDDDDHRRKSSKRRRSKRRR